MAPRTKWGVTALNDTSSSGASPNNSAPGCFPYSITMLIIPNNYPFILQYSPVVSRIQDSDHQTLRAFVMSTGSNAWKTLPVIRTIAKVVDTLHYMGLGQISAKHVFINTDSYRVSI